MDVKNVLFMNKGEGENSYAQHSRFTQVVASKAKAALQEAVQSVVSNDLKGVVNVADLGCSSGPNTLHAMSTVVETVEKLCSSGKDLELQIFLNDLPGNDFNNVFQQLPGFCQRNLDHVAVPFFVMGAPGSFHGRLFPRNTMDLIYCSYSVHWLSQVPKLVNEEGLALNKGAMYISETSPPMVRELYVAQFESDLTSFLKARSEEMTSVGRVVLVVQGDDSALNLATDSYHPWKALTDAINQMISQGSIEEEKLDSFNVPYYASSTEEIQNLVEEEGSFAIEHMKTFTIEGREVWVCESGDEGTRRVAEIAAKNFRCFTEPMISSHFGEENMDELYGKFVENVLFDDMSKGPILFNSIIVVLKRKG